MAKIQDGSYVVVYDRSNSLSQDVWAQAFDANLQALWQSPISSEENGVSPFILTGEADGSLFVVGRRTARSYVVKMDRKGNRLWTFYGELGKTGLVSHVALGESEFFIGSSGTIYSCDRPVKLTKLLVN